MELDFILYAFALVCFVLSAAGVATGRYNLIGAGLAFFTAAVMF